MQKIFCLFFLLINCTLFAQIELPNRDAAYRELQQRGLSVAEFQARMLERGYDIENIDPLTVNLSTLEQEVETVVREMEAEKNAQQAFASDTLIPAIDTIPVDSLNNPNALAQASAERIKRLVNQGVPLEEAIAIDLIETGTENLPESNIFGQHIFRNKDLQLYNSAVDVRPPDNYVLGVGDQITVLIWGASIENASYEINKSGYIQPSGMQRISLKGLTYMKAKDLLRRRFAENYRFRPEEFDVTIDNIRTITVNIIGEAINAGSYNLPALNTAFNALVAANGPSDIGSVRNIQLIHANGNTQRLDVYEFMLDPSKVKDYFLLNNDYIFIPVAEKMVKIEGAVNRPFQYELIANEGIVKLIEYAGGFQQNAIQQNVQIQRFENDETRIIDINVKELMETGRDFALQNGDVISVKEITQSFENYANVEGAVQRPGVYAIEKNMRFSDLIQKAGLNKDAKTDDAFVQRLRPDGQVQSIRINIQNILENPSDATNELLQDEDKLIVFSQTGFVDKQTVAVAGAVRTPGTYPFDPSENLKVEDVILLGGGITDEATDFAYIYRRDPETRKLQEYIRVNLNDALSKPLGAENLNLRPYDSLVVYNYKDYLENAFVKVQGAVRSPGSFRYDESLTLKDVLTLSGGLRLDASMSRIDISSVLIDDKNETQTIVTTLEIDKDMNILNKPSFQLQPYDLIYVRQAPEFEFQQTIVLKGEVVYPGKHALIKNNEKVLSVIKRAGGVTNEAFLKGATLYRTKDNVGYVIMDLEEVFKLPNSIHNFILKDGDIIEIPKQKDFVSIKGATRANELYPDRILQTGRFNVPFHYSKTAKWYVNEYAAGLGENGRRKLITVEHPNGQIEKTRNYVLFKKYPKVQKGSTISVGEKIKVKKEKTEDKKEVNWRRVIADSLAQATAVLSLILLVEQVSK